MDSRLLYPSSLSPNPCCVPRPRLSPRPRLLLPRATTDGDATDAGDRQAESAAVPSAPSPPALNIKYRSRSRARRQQEQKQQQRAPRKQPPPKKDWEAMTSGEKAVDLYMGEKGLLFWLNKIAYALIFVIAGGWILFRFVGPALGLYQLDSAPLPPSAMFKASP